jgi:hypothetical protein
MREIEHLLKQGVGDNEHFRDKSGRVVAAKFIKSEVYLREDVTKPWENVGERIPKGANAQIINRVWKSGTAYFYEIYYYKIRN